MHRAAARAAGAHLGLPDEEVQVRLVHVYVFVLHQQPEPDLREPLDRDGVRIPLEVVVRELLYLLYILPVALGVHRRQEVPVLARVQHHVVVLVEAVEDLVDLLVAALPVALRQRGLAARAEEGPDDPRR